jgi:hypothetical protein
MYLGGIYILPRSVLLGISIFLYCMRELLAQPQEQREGQGTAAKQWFTGWPQFPALPSAPVEPRIHINDQHTNLQVGILWIINGDN